MALNEPTPAHLSVAEVDNALRNLSDIEWYRLQTISKSLARTYPLEAEELLHEACCRALDGSRNCPRHVDIIQFLAGAMKSIASDTLKSEKRYPKLRLVLNSEDDDEEILDLPDDRLNVEEELEQEHEAGLIRKRILDLFHDDPIAQIMVEGIMEDMEGEELQGLTSLDKTAFESKRKLIRRRIVKGFPEGWKNDQS